MRKKICGYFILIFILLILISGTTNLKKDNIKILNEDSYDISFDVKKNTIKYDNKSAKITEVLDIDKDQLNEITDDYLKKILVGDITKDNNKIVISNPYSLKTLIVKVSDKNTLDDYDNILSCEKLADNTYIVHYKTAKDTKESYNELKSDNIEVYTDKKVSILDDNKTKIMSVNSNYLAWGVEFSAFDHYIDKINYQENDNEVKIAVLDTGINRYHEAFSNKSTADRLDFTHSYDYVNKDSDPTDDEGHGTMVSGVIAESTPTNVKIVPVKVMDSNGKGAMSNIMKAAKEVSSYVDVINLSVGSISDKEDGDKEYKETYDIIEQNGAVIIAAAGNSSEENNYENEGVNYPASSDYTYAVSSIDKNNNLSVFSDYGEEVDFTMPGEELDLPYYTGDSVYAIDAGGTSFSCPFFASAYALAKIDNPTSDDDEIIELLKENTIDLGTSGKDEKYGWGVVDFSSNMFKKPVIVKTIVPEEWTTLGNISFSAVSSNKMNGYSITTTSTVPTNWTAISPSTKMSLSKEISENGTYYIWLKDKSNNITSQQINVSYIDNIKPEIMNEISVSDVTSSTVKLGFNAKDVDSGISKIVWKYKKESDQIYKTKTVYYDGLVDEINVNSNLLGLTSNTDYSVYAIVYDEVGNTSETSSIEFRSLPQTRMYIDSPNNNQNVKTSVDINGWVMSEDSGASVKIVVDGNEYTPTRYEREDVLKAISGYGGRSTNSKPGYKLILDTTGLTDGVHQIEIKIYSSVGNELLKETKKIKVKKYNATSYIDNPYENQATDGILNYYGWIMSEDPNSTIKIYVDEEEQEEPERYEREDVLKAITGYGGRSTNKTPGYRGSIDVSKYELGSKHEFKIEVISSKGDIITVNKTTFKVDKPQTKMYIDSPNNNQNVKTSVDINGWVMSEDSSASVKIVVDGNEYTPTRYEREDVLKAISGYGGRSTNSKPGYKLTLDTLNLEDGKYEVEVQVLSSGGNIIASENKIVEVAK